jgi:hypothetical protein
MSNGKHWPRVVAFLGLAAMLGCSRPAAITTDPTKTAVPDKRPATVASPGPDGSPVAGQPDKSGQSYKGKGKGGKGKYTGTPRPGWTPTPGAAASGT